MRDPWVVRRRSRSGKVLICLMLAFAGALPAAAQIVAPAGRTLFNRGVLVRALGRVDELRAAEGIRERRLTLPVAVVVGAGPRLSVSVVTPFVAIDDGDRTTSGRGDTSVIARRELWRRDERGGTTRVGLEAGLRLPTGSDGLRAPGVDPIFGLVLARLRDPHWLVGDAIVTVSGDDRDGRRPDAVLRYDLAYLYRWWPRAGLGVPAAYLVAELNGERRLDGPLGMDEDLLFFSPGLELILSRRVILELGLSVPLVRDLAAATPRPRSEALLLGIRWVS